MNWVSIMEIETEANSYPEEPWQRQRMRASRITIGDIGSRKKEIGSEQKLAEVKDILEEWMKFPSWLSIAISEIDRLKARIDEHEEVIAYLSIEKTRDRNEINELKRDIALLKSHSSDIKKTDDLWIESRINAQSIRLAFHLEKETESTAEEALSELGGILKDCRKEGIDSVTLVRSIRGD
jgi:hypothetical protein